MVFVFLILEEKTHTSLIQTLKRVAQIKQPDWLIAIGSLLYASEEKNVSSS